MRTERIYLVSILGAVLLLGIVAWGGARAWASESYTAQALLAQQEAVLSQGQAAKWSAAGSVVQSATGLAPTFGGIGMMLLFGGVGVAIAIGGSRLLWNTGNAVGAFAVAVRTRADVIQYELEQRKALPAPKEARHETLVDSNGSVGQWPSRVGAKGLDLEGAVNALQRQYPGSTRVTKSAIRTR